MHLNGADFYVPVVIYVVDKMHTYTFHHIY